LKLVDEFQLIENLKEGHEPTYRFVVEKYLKNVVNTCFGLVHNRADAEDIAQEVFIEVHRSVHRFRADAKLSSWIYRIAVNKSLNFIRDNKKSRRLSSGYDDAQSIRAQAGENDHPEKNLLNKERARILHEAVSRLPENQKIAFTLNKYEDLSYAEISEVMEVSLSSVESLIHRAKLNLQKQLIKCYKKKCI